MGAKGRPFPARCPEYTLIGDCFFLLPGPPFRNLIDRLFAAIGRGSKLTGHGLDPFFVGFATRDPIGPIRRPSDRTRLLARLFFPSPSLEKEPTTVFEYPEGHGLIIRSPFIFSFPLFSL